MADVDDVVEGLGAVPAALGKAIRKVMGERGCTASEALAVADVALAADSADPLAAFREEFVFPKQSQAQAADGDRGTMPGEPCVYLCGNSLGLQPRKARDYVLEEMDNWAERAVEGHFSGARPWVAIDEVCIKEMATMVGAKESEVATMSSLTVNLHLLMISFYRPSGKRCKILLEAKSFPSDYIAVRSQILEKGLDPEECMVFARPREGEDTVRTEDICALVDEHADELALVLLPGIQYYTGQVFQMREITAHAHRATDGKCRVGFDLAHAVGNVELCLHDWGVDFACWCTYKYLNSGPGGVGGAFVHERHGDDSSIPRLAGWWGHRKEDRFLMAEQFLPSKGAMGWQLSNPAVLTLATLRASLELFARATMPALRLKSVALTRYLELLLEAELPAGSCRSITPPFDRAAERGAQLSLVFRDPIKAVHHAVEREGVICDMREPDVMRIAPAPLYNSFHDVWLFVGKLKRAMASCGAPTAA